MSSFKDFDTMGQALRLSLLMTMRSEPLDFEVKSQSSAMHTLRRHIQFIAQHVEEYVDDEIENGFSFTVADEFIRTIAGSVEFANKLLEEEWRKKQAPSAN